MEQSDALDDIVKKIGKRNGIANRNELVRTIIRDFIEGYEEKHDLVQARKIVKDKVMKPISVIF